MSITLPLEEMTIAEKLQTMESLWDDLCHSAEGIKSPHWHKDILLKREHDIKNNKDSFLDWEQAKKDIRDSVQ
jgi:putative addiction module component (TIGR02574 family)